MGKLTRRNFLKSSSAAAGALGIGPIADLWATSEDTKPALAEGTFMWPLMEMIVGRGSCKDPDARKSNGPFATLQRARDAVRELKEKRRRKNQSR